MIINAGMFSANNLPHVLLLATKQTTKLRNAIENNMPTDIKLPKAQISKIIQSRGFLGSLLSKTAGPLIQKKIHGSGATTLLISNEEINDIMKIVQALEDSNILLKGVTKTIKNETKEQKGGFLSMLLGTLGAPLLGNLLSGKGTRRAGEGILRDGYGSSIKKKL